MQNNGYTGTNGYSWDFAGSDKIEIYFHGKIVMTLSMYEILDCGNPYLIESHIQTIKDSKSEIGVWKKYMGQKLIKALLE